MGRGGSAVRSTDCQSRGLRFETTCCRFETWVHPTLHVPVGPVPVGPVPVGPVPVGPADLVSMSVKDPAMV